MKPTASQQAAVVALLSRPETFGPGVRRVERIDTHISQVFLAGDGAWKLKRAVVLPFLDFSTAERRRLACEAELRLNRRTAPELYREVVPVTDEGGGRLALAGKGEPVDWLVAMARFPQSALLDHLVAAGRLTSALAKGLAEQIASFHTEAEIRTDLGGTDGMRRILDTNLRSFAGETPGVFTEAAVARMDERMRAALAALGSLLETRRREGRVRHCHGDLHLGNICLFEGKPLLFDAIEFNEDFACIDVFYDLAFLLMDLDHRGRRDLANRVLNRYLECTGDFDGLPPLPLFLALRAAVRAVVSAQHAHFGPAAVRAERRAVARRLLEESSAFLDPVAPRLVAVGGLSGTGKSRLARALAPLFGAAPGAVVLRTDVLRKRLVGVSPETRLPEDAYTVEMSRRTYAAMLDIARRAMAAGFSVIADAVFARPDERQAIEEIARARGASFAGLWLEAKPSVARRRIETRSSNASDATPAVLRRQLSYDLGRIDWRRIDSSGARGRTVAAARDCLEV